MLIKQNQVEQGATETLLDHLNVRGYLFPQDKRCLARDVRIKSVTMTFEADKIDIFFDKIACALKEI
jgi:hypothetical protein